VTDEQGELAIISPRGDLDARSAGEFQNELDRLLGKGIHYFVVDLGNVGFVDSAGLATLIRLYKRVRIGEGDVQLAAVPPPVMEILALTRLDRVFEITDTPLEAARSMTQHS
jgi:anti-sigma B factor antagonist